MPEAIVLLKTGISDIDRQHAQLLIYLRDLKEFVGGKYEFAAAFTAVNALLDYTQQHFAYEEGLLLRYGYPRLEEHIAEHMTLIENVRRQWDKIEQGYSDIALEVVETIERWIVEHINAEDIEYAKFLNLLN